MNFFHLRSQAPERLPLAIAVIALAAMIVAWISRTRGKRISVLARSLPALRIVALAALLFSITKPVIVRSQIDSLEGELVVLLDRSRSMSVSDPERSPAQRVAIADACGLLGDGVRFAAGRDEVAAARALNNLADAIGTARSEVEYSQLAGHGIAAATQRLHAATEALKDAAAALQTQATGQPNTAHLFAVCREIVDQLNASESTPMTNGAYQQLRRTLIATSAAAVEPQAAADETLYRTNPAARESADTISSMSRVEIAAHVLRQLSPELPSDIRMSIHDLSSALTPFAVGSEELSIAEGETTNFGGALLAERDRRPGGKVLAVVLISDGRQVGGTTSPVSFDVPFISINAGESVHQDVSIAAVDAPASLRLHEPCTISATLQAVGIHDQPVDVSIDDAGDITSQHALISDGKTKIQFEKQFDTAGLRDLKINVSTPLPDVHPANKTVHRFVQVCNSPVDVLLVPSISSAGTSSIEQMLTATSWLRRDPDNKPTTTVDGRSMSDDVIVLNEFPADFPIDRYRAMINRVRQGGGLIMIAGTNFDPVAFEKNTLLAPLLPWSEQTIPQWKTLPPDSAGMTVIPAEPSPITHLNDNAGDSRRRWEQLPGIHSVLSMNSLKSGVTPILVEADDGRAVLTESRLGAGRVLFLATNQTDRWRGKLNPREPDAFWISLIREAAGPPFTMQNDAGALDIEPPVVSPGRQAVIRVKSAPKNAGVELFRDGQAIGPVPMKPVANDQATHQFTGMTPALPLGIYEVRVRFADGKR